MQFLNCLHYFISLISVTNRHCDGFSEGLLHNARCGVSQSVNFRKIKAFEDGHMIVIKTLVVLAYVAMAFCWFVAVPLFVIYDDRRCGHKSSFTIAVESFFRELRA